MKRHRFMKLAAIGAAISAAPLLLWVALVILAPTGWVKRHVVAALEARSHRSVKVDGVSACLWGGIRLTNIEIGSPLGIEDPWLKVADLRLDVSLFQLLLGRFQPSLAEVSGVHLRVLRRADGSVELADLARPINASEHDDGDSEPSAEAPRERARGRLAVQLHDATVVVRDESTQTRLRFQNVDGEGSCDGQLSSIDRLQGTINGGPFRLVAHLDRSAPTSRFEARFIADDVNLDDGMSEILRYVVPVLAGSAFNLQGKVHTDFQLHGTGTTRDRWSETLEGHGQIAINPINLDGAPVVHELTRLSDISGRGRVASVRSDFRVKDRRISTDHFTLNLGRTPITMSGWTDLDGRIEYQIRLDALTQRIPDKARRILDELNIDARGLSALSLNGTVDKMSVRLNGTALDRTLAKENGIHRDDRDKLRLLGRQFLDKISR